MATSRKTYMDKDIHTRSPVCRRWPPRRKSNMVEDIGLFAPLPEEGSIEEALTCPIDREPLRNPKVLRCGDSFCKACLDKLLLKSKRGGETYIVCPVCKQTTLILGGDTENLPDNTAVRQVLDRASRHQKPSLACSSCHNPRTGISSNSEIKFFCFNCSQYFCQTCRWKHRMMFREHDAVINLKCVTQLNTVCREHHQYVKKYCDTCSKSVCSRCVFENHHNHNVIGITERSTIAAKIAAVKRRQPVLESNLRKANARTERLQKVQKKHSDRYANMDAELQNCHEQLKRKLDEWYNRMEKVRVEQKLSFEKRLDITQEHMNNYVQSCESLKEYVERVLKEDIGTQPLTLYAGLLARMSTLEDPVAGIDTINEVSVVKFVNNDQLLRSFSLPDCWEYEQLDVSFKNQEATLTPTPGSSIFSLSSHLSNSSCTSLGMTPSDVDSGLAGPYSPVGNRLLFHTSLIPNWFLSSSSDFTQSGITSYPFGRSYQTRGLHHSNHASSEPNLAYVDTDTEGMSESDIHFTSPFSSKFEVPNQEKKKKKKIKRKVWKTLKSRLGFGKKEDGINRAIEVVPGSSFDDLSLSEQQYNYYEEVYTTRL